MKRLTVVMIILCLIPVCVFAVTDYLDMFSYYISDDANEAAKAANIPSILSQEEHAIFRLGYAYGYDAGKAAAASTRALDVVEPDKPTFIYNRASNKFHVPECYMVNAILFENREELYCSYDEAVNVLHYLPCGKCLKNAKTEEATPEAP